MIDEMMKPTMSERSEGGSRAEWVGLSIVVNRNGGDSRSGGEPHVNTCQPEMAVKPAEGWSDSMGRGKARPQAVQVGNRG